MAVILKSLKFKRFTDEELFNFRGVIKGIVYARVSSADQVDKYSIDSQIDICKKHLIGKLKCKDEEILVIVEPGEMGDDPNRPALTEMLRLVDESIGKMVCILHPNRLARDVTLQNAIAMRIWEAGLSLEFVEFDLNPDNPESMLMFNIHGAIAQYNKAKTLADSKRGRWTKIKNKQIPGHRKKFGYTFNKETDTLETNPEEKRIYLLMVEWLLYGTEDKPPLSASALGRELALRNFKPPIGTKWHQGTISRILKDQTYATGKFYYMKTEIKQKKGQKVVVRRDPKDWVSFDVESFIDEETHLKVLETLKKNGKQAKGRPKKQYLMRGLLRCGRCGAALCASGHSKMKTAEYSYYSCINKGNKHYVVGTGETNKKCKGRTFRVDIVDAHIWSFVKSLIYNPKLLIEKIEQVKGDASKREKLQTQLTELMSICEEKQRIKTRYLDLYAFGEIGSREELERKTAGINEDLVQLQGRIEDLENALKTFEQKILELDSVERSLQRFQQMLRNDEISFEQKQQVIRSLIQKVILHDNNDMEIFAVVDIPELTNPVASDTHFFAHKHIRSNHSQRNGGQEERIHSYTCRLSR